MKIYAVIDRKAKAVVNIFASQSDESAERSFLMLLSGAKSIFTDFPEDFDLYQVAVLSYSASGLNISEHGIEHIKDAGFNINNFTVREPLKAGVDYDKRYLAMLHHDRFEISEEVTRDGTDK